MAKKKLATTTPAERLLAFAKEQAAAGKTGVELHNAIFGIGGKLLEFFPSDKDRIAFAKTPEFKQISEIASIAKDLRSKQDDQASGKFILRLPTSMHAALVAEADAEGVSLNQLCVAKLAVQLRSILK